MRLKARPEDFRVEELIELPKGPGQYTYLRVEKRGIPTMAAQVLLARALGVSPREVFFPALKDAHAVAIQYASVVGRRVESVELPGIRAEAAGEGPRRLSTGDLRGNRFRLVVRDLGDEAEGLAEELLRLGAEGFPNYFDEQRFGSLGKAGSPGKAVLARDAEAAVRFYLAEELFGDPEEVRRFKALAREHWGEWGFLLERAPKPSNFRSVLTFLRDHPGAYRKALNLIPPRLLSLFLSAYQSLLWNRILGRWISRKFADATVVEIAGEGLPVPVSVPREITPRLRRERLALPHVRARYRGEWDGIAREVLAEEGITFRDLKARIVERAYLSKAERPIWCFPRGIEVGEPRGDELFPGKRALEVSFSLPPGSYATLLVRCAHVRALRPRG
ncbi:MAG: tRNA pseudouridine(13) synthase TruD [Caldiserica bacterium]|nr:tRNA pseudouridine(13) synthase TruD [Caldisericota bacterium]